MTTPTITVKHGRHLNDIMTPTEPTPDGKVGVLCTTCGELFEVANPAGKTPQE